MAKTAAGLVEYAKAQVGKPYWWSTYGQTASASLLSSIKAQYPSDTASYGSECAAQYEQRVHDCVGLIKGYLWSETATSEPVYNAAQDVNCTGMYSKASAKGAISTFSKTNGALIFRGSSTGSLTHVGVYCSDGYVYEARGHAYGVCKTAYSSTSWNYWCLCPFITYDGSEAAISGDLGGDNTSSDTLSVDGQWGCATTRAVQQILGTEVDGEVSHQYAAYKSDNPGLLSQSWKWEYQPAGYSPMVHALQNRLGVTTDGHIGPITIKALQTKYGTGADGKIDNPSPCVRALQNNLNSGRLW